MTIGHRQWIATLRESHNHLNTLVDGLSAARIAGPSYCTEWSTAQVLSHLGSGAEIGVINLEAALRGDPSPRDQYQAIWDVWNAKSPAAMAADALVADERHISTLEALDDSTLDAFRLEMMGRQLDATALVAMRLFEHAVHTWDVEVIDDDSIEIQDAPSQLLVGRLADRIGRSASGPKPKATPARIAVHVTAPDEVHGLAITDDGVSLDDETDGDGHLAIGAGALLRLVSGRLDPDHTPASTEISGPVSLGELRELFPGS